ncbi:hypothetical protein M758_10G064000 [Ceratodon purpureus]|nr:hypothetical protein M758_10G064000 [Ceratodon purpureus]
MATSRNVLLLVLTCVYFVAVAGNFTINTPLTPSAIICLEECHFFPENRTIAIIDIMKPTATSVKGVAYYSEGIRMKDPATRKVASFKTSFTFREEPMNYSTAPGDDPRYFKRGDGFTFMMSNSSIWTGDAAGRFGIFKSSDISRVFAIEYDSYSGPEDLGLLQEEHVGVDIGNATSLNGSVNPNCFAYVKDTLGITFWHRDVLYSWIEYDGTTKMLEVRLANTSSRPVNPLINCYIDLYDALDEKMWIGFSGSFGDAWSIYYIYDWTFTSFGIPSEFPSPPSKLGLILGVCGGILLATIVVAVAVFVYLRKKRAREESWDNEGMLEMAGMPEFISYKHLSAATKQFSDQSKLGEGGFGSVYRGVLPKTGALVAVKKVSNDSRQGEREFLAEVQIISQLRHRNIVELVGFCRDRGKFMLVYELMPKGSLDQALFKPKSPDDVLSWGLRWKIVSGTAAALHYLHEGWRQQVIHRDVKSSNIMLDDEYNPKLGDFGLARLVDHEKHAATTMVAGTFGYIAPEAAGSGKFTDKTDVFAFGAVCLELACGRKAYDGSVKNYDDLILVDMVWRHLNEDDLLGVADPLLQDQFDVEQMYKVLKLGLLCSHPDPSSRPTMRQVEQVLAGDADVPEVPDSKPKVHMGSERVHFSIDDLMSTTSSTQNSKSSSKRPVSATSTSFGAPLYPR